jgi:hypothetical protein
MVTGIGVMTLVNGVLNILWALGLTATVVFGTVGIGLLCAPITMVPAVLGVFEIVYGAQVLTAPPRPIRPSYALGILEICMILWGNVISLVVGILALVFYGDLRVRAYYATINAPRAPATG